MNLDALLQDGWKRIQSLPDDPKDSVSIGKMTPNAQCFALVFPIDEGRAMPFNNNWEIINGIHRSLAENQALIEVNSGCDKDGVKYVYSIIKTLQEQQVVQYFARVNIKTASDYFEANAFFDETGTTGFRDATIYEYVKRQYPEDEIQWMKDPYDDTFQRPYLMNLSELEQFDEMFSDHPLSQARRFIRLLVANQQTETENTDHGSSNERTDGYVGFMDGLYMGLKDIEGNVVISPDKGYRSIYDFVDGVAIVFKLNHASDEGGWGLINEKGEEITPCKYWYIEPFAGKNLYLVHVTSGLRKNLMWNNGSLVFAENYQDIYKNSYRNGYVIVGNTIRKTKTTPRRYPKGLLHISGEVLLPVEYDTLEWMKGYDDILCTQRDGHFGYVRALYGAQSGVEFDVTLPGMWFGVKGTICEGCIYSRGIEFEGKGCGRLFTKSFRDRNLAGKCEFRKTALREPSQFERKAIERWKIIVRWEDPFREPRQLLNDFINEHLGGDINGLTNYDFRQLDGMERYGDTHGYSDIYRTDLVRAIATLAFQDIAPKEIMFSKKTATLVLSPSPLIQEDLWGNQIGDHFAILSMFHLSNEEMAHRIIPCAKLCNTIGNLYLQPYSFQTYRHSHAQGRFLMDHAFADLHKALTSGTPSRPMKNAIYDSNKFFEQYKGFDGWCKLMERWLTLDLVDYHMNPIIYFDDFNLNTYIPKDVFYKALNQCLELCYKIIPRRAEQIVERLKRTL